VRLGDVKRRSPQNLAAGRLAGSRWGITGREFGRFPPTGDG